MKNILLLSILITSLFFTINNSEAMETIDGKLKLLPGNWVEALYDAETNAVKEKPPTRGGHKSIQLKEDGTIVWSGGFNCGFGTKQSGQWSYNKKTNLLNISLDEQFNVRGTESPKEIDIKMEFHLVKLTDHQLLLQNKEGDYIAFRR